ncbi:T9SS type A sorting domain-containing protein [Frigoriflavimonas asaccharolytica]|uniref:Fibronectin type-III domain-containing protein n=1 Tax=Frigoriflavimonas asaccharolytica TaxID=2735899 RepID=A0A8J8G9U3_9FLAO|nr:T9SS type A sorting domain-containing protein [Frigoriflavimonas asaccharolytica]NRS91930.1 hypothetical protein [Frigoriflavimonas asaccharolytica]
MKKNLLLLVFAILFSGILPAQVLQYNLALDANGSTSGNSRAPQGTIRYSRTVYVITAAEMTSSGLVSGNTINGIGFNYSTAQNLATTGNFKVYLQNTTDVANNKSTDWATSLAGMTQSSNGSVTIPATTGQVNHAFTGGSTFTYTGGGLYVAFEYENVSGTLPTVSNVAACTTSITNGLKSAQSTIAMPTTTAASNFRPQTYLATLVSCASPTNIDASTVTNTTATLTWTAANGNPPTYDLEYGPIGFTQGSGTTVSVSGTTYTFPAQAVGSNLSFYLRSNCGASQSAWLGAYNVFLIKTPPYANNFDTANNRSDGFVGTTGWSIAVDSPAITVSQTPDGFFYSNNSTTAATSQQMYSRPVNLFANNSNTATYYTRAYAFDVSTGVPGTVSPMLLKVYRNTTRSLTGATQIGTAITVNGVTHVMQTSTFTVPTTGTYYLIFSNETPVATGATNTTALIFDTFAINSTLSTNEVSAEDLFSIYPNPTSDVLNIKTDGKIKSVTIFDMAGRKMDVKILDSKIDVKNLDAGGYLISVETTKGISTEKFIKK